MNSLESAHFCLLEDDPDEGELLKLALERRGGRVTWLQTIEEAKTELATTRFDALLSDLTLPDGDGLALARELRIGNPDLTLVALTGHGSGEMQDATRAAGFSAHFTKPLDIAALLTWLTSEVANRNAARKASGSPQA